MTDDSLRVKIMKTMAQTEKNIKQKTGIAGGLAEIVSTVAGAVSKGAAAIQKKVDENGGYAATIDKGLEQAGKAVDRLSDVVGGKLEGAGKAVDRFYDKFNEDFFNDGQIDKTKVREALEDRTQAASKYGEKALKVLEVVARGAGKAAKFGAGMVVKEYRKYVVSQEDRDGIYVGIGTNYEGEGRILLRQNFDAVLAFSQKAEKVLPAKMMYRAKIIADLKASASQDVNELVCYYAEKGGAGALKVKALKPYLKALGRNKK